MRYRTGSAGARDARRTPRPVRGPGLLCILIALPVVAWPVELASPDGSLRVQVTLDADARPVVQLFRRDEAIVRRSPLGVSLGDTDFRDDLTIVSVSDPEMVSGRYRLWTGKQSPIEYSARVRRLAFENTAGRRLGLTLRMSDDGLAYRYEIPAAVGEERVVEQEHGGVRFFPETRAWLQPKANAQTGWSNTNPSYEENYLQEIPVGTPSPTESGWVYPALFRYRDHWIVLTEAGMDGRYPGSNLAQSSDDGLYPIRFPQAAEVVTDGNRLPRFRTGLHSPWRILVVGDLPTVMRSTLGTDVAEPLAVDDTGFIDPGIAVWSWGLLKDESVVYPVQKEFVDYAARMGWPYALVDVNWDRNIGYEKIGELAGYAAGKGVGLILWYNSSGAWNETDYSPKGKLLSREDRRAEFARLQAMGIRGVKVDFFPGDGASAIAYYRDILRDAAEHELMVNFHGSTLPRGLHRTFPNLVTSEAVKGMEFVTFAQENADQQATHAAMLPFTRNLFDPMDYTPMALGDIPNIERRTTFGFELALPVLFLSGVQHLVTTPAQMRDVPDSVQDYLRNLPGRWDESRFVAGFPGRYVVIARRSGQRWYVAGINADELRQLDPDLSFAGSGQGIRIRDGKAGQLLVESVAPADAALELRPGSGFVMIFDSTNEE